MNNGIIMLSAAEQVSMADEWFEFAKADHFWMHWRFTVIQKIMTKLNLINPGMSYLEIGCGNGQFLKQFESSISGALDGCDLNVNAMNQIVGVKGNIMVYNILEKQEMMLNKYDGIFLLDVIEHIEDDSEFLRSAIAHLKPGGFVIINVPALNFLFSKYDIVAGHKRRYKNKSLTEVMTKQGLTVRYVGYWGFLLLGVAFLRKLFLAFVPEKKVIHAGFKPPGSAINTWFKIIMKMELALFGNPILGTSLIGVGIKEPNEDKIY